MAGRSMFRLMEAARTAGYRVELHYVSVASPEQALDRVRNRVALGGHDVPEPDLRRRFSRSLAHLPTAIALSDEARLYDNASLDDRYREVAILTGESKWTAEDLPVWAVAAATHMFTPRK